MVTLKKQTIGGLLKSTAGRFPNHEAVVYSELDLRYSYQELVEKFLFARSLAAAVPSKTAMMPAAADTWMEISIGDKNSSSITAVSPS